MPSATTPRENLMGKISGGVKILRGMKQEADGKALSDTRLRTAGRELIDRGRSEIHQPRAAGRR